MMGEVVRLDDYRPKAPPVPATLESLTAQLWALVARIDAVTEALCQK